MAMRDPWLSIVVPTHNGERWLHETLSSIAMQNEAGLDCVVVDSSPSEATADIVRSYADGLAIRLFRRPDLAHWRSKTNFGFAEALAPHACMLHQDDYWLPGRAAAVRSWIAAAPDVAMHIHPAYFVDANGRRRGVWRCPLPAGPTVKPEVMLERLLVQNFVSIPTPVIRRDTYLSCGGLDESLWYTGDWDLYLKLAKAGQVMYHREVLSCFRIHGQSMTVTGSRDAADFEAQMRAVLAAHIDSVAPSRRAAILRKAQASIKVNLSLAAAIHGTPWKGVGALTAMLALGPVGLCEYLRDSRLIERLSSRLRTRFALVGAIPNAMG